MRAATLALAVDDDLLDLTLIQTAQNKDVGFAKFRMGGNICYPKGMILRQARDVFCQYLEKNPSERHQDGGYLIRLAFGEAWPCK
ncbi:Rap1a/Tai family immunity protein [Rhizobium ruizarguesonis]